MLGVGFTALACVLIAKSDSLLWAVVAAAPFAAGFAVAFAAQLRVPFFLPARNGDHETGGGRSLLTLNRLDRARPSWSAAWAWNLRAGAVTPSWRIFGAGLAMSLAVLISAVDGIVYHQAAPGAIAGLAGGLAVFMLALRYHPLGSPVLRTAPIGFRRGWLRLLWLPLQLSTAFFLLPTGAALAAEPSSWSLLAASGMWLLMLNCAFRRLFHGETADRCVQLPGGDRLCHLRILRVRPHGRPRVFRPCHMAVLPDASEVLLWMTATMDPRTRKELLRLSNLSVGYGGRAVIAGVDLAMRSGDILGLLGANGSGKSTLIKSITGQLRPRTGAIAIDGIDLARKPEQAKARFGLAIDVTDLSASLSGRQYLDLVASLRSCAPTDWRDRDLLARLGITAWLDRQIAEYSLGTRAKIAITAALIGSPPLLIFDESLNGLDPLAAWEMKSLLIELAASGRHAVLISTHVVETMPAFAIEPYSSPKAKSRDHGKVMILPKCGQHLALSKNALSARSGLNCRSRVLWSPETA